MPSISSILDTITKDFPHLTFQPSTEFGWSSAEETIFYVAHDSPSLLLHELGHAQLKHTDYKRDIELIAFERDAWDYAVQELSPPYSITITENEIEEALDTYRDWLHARSSCPRCSSTGLQTTRDSYRCLACRASWNVNEARTCGLRRRLLT